MIHSGKSILTFCGFWYPYTPTYHSNLLFIYSDNDAKIGKNEQAVIRDSPNTIGIPTMKFPINDPCAYYTDDELENNKSKIDTAIEEIKKRIPNYKGIVLPEMGIGSGIAKLDTVAPLTYIYLSHELEKLKDYIRNYNETLIST